MTIQKLAKPDKKTIEAFVILQDERRKALNAIIDYLEISKLVILQKFNASKSERFDCEVRGALQVIDDLIEINTHSVEWWVKIRNE